MNLLDLRGINLMIWSWKEENQDNTYTQVCFGPTAPTILSLQLLWHFILGAQNQTSSLNNSPTLWF